MGGKLCLVKRKRRLIKTAQMLKQGEKLLQELLQMQEIAKLEEKQNLVSLQKNANSSQNEKRPSRSFFIVKIHFIL